MYDDIVPVATCRIFYDNERKAYIIGRVAVVKQYRSKHLGSMIMVEAENYIKSIGGKNIGVSAQCRVSDFYKKLGYTEEGEMYYDEFCPHIFMRKTV